MTPDPRRLAFLALRAVQRGAYADAALDKALSQASGMSEVDRRLATELVYGCVRRQRTLDAIVDHLVKKKQLRQPRDLRVVLHLGIYQLRYLDHIPDSAAVNTSVELAKRKGLAGLAGLVNGILRQYTRLDPDLLLPDDPIERCGIQHSFPNWIVGLWHEQLGLAETEQLCDWLNRPPHIDLRVNVLRTSREAVHQAMTTAGIRATLLPQPQGLRLHPPTGAIQKLPGYSEGLWMVQDSSAQLVAHLLDPQPGEMVVDACAAPGGKTMHLAELMGDRGRIEACDRTPTRLTKLRQNAHRLGLKSIQICVGDSRNMPQFIGQCDRVLLDGPCSGLGTLHRHADARWRQTPQSILELANLQMELLEEAATWVKPTGVLVYATCTLHPDENERLIQQFLNRYSQWRIDPPIGQPLFTPYLTPEGWLKVWPHHHDMDGFFMVRLRPVSGDRV